MKKYFENCRTAEELKKTYRQIVKKLHPDMGGDEEAFKAMQKEYCDLWEKLKDVHTDKDGREYRRETAETADEFMEIIEKLIKLDGVKVEICGSWIWCTGDTKPYKDIFKKLRFRWSAKKMAWYFHNEPYRKHHGRELSLTEIRNMYGSQKYNHKNDEERLALQA